MSSIATTKGRNRGHIEQLPSGSYRATVYAGIDPLTRKLRYLRETTGTRREAEVALTRLQNQVDEKCHPRSAITVAQAVEQWLEVATLEASTRERYEDLVRLHIAPTLGDTQVGRLDAELLERLYARLRRCRHLCAGRPRRGHTCVPLAANTVRKVHSRRAHAEPRLGRDVVVAHGVGVLKHRAGLAGAMDRPVEERQTGSDRTDMVTLAIQRDGVA